MLQRGFHKRSRRRPCGELSAVITLAPLTPSTAQRGRMGCPPSQSSTQRKASHREGGQPAQPAEDECHVRAKDALVHVGLVDDDELRERGRRPTRRAPGASPCGACPGWSRRSACCPQPACSDCGVSPSYVWMGSPKRDVLPMHDKERSARIGPAQVLSWEICRSRAPPHRRHEVKRGYRVAERLAEPLACRASRDRRPRARRSLLLGANTDGFDRRRRAMS